MSDESPLSGSALLSVEQQGGRAPPFSPADPVEVGRLHEYLSAQPEDVAAAAAAALLAASTSASGIRPLVWLRTQAAERRTGRLHGPGLAQLGLSPRDLLLGLLPDDLTLLKAAAELLKSGAAGAVLLELHGPAPRLDLTASRRLALAAAAGNSTALLLRVGAGQASSAAWRRWKVASRPSRPLAAEAPGPPAFGFELLRNRSGPAGASFRLDWCAGRLVSPHRIPESADDALSRHPLSLSAGRPLPQERRAA